MISGWLSDSMVVLVMAVGLCAQITSNDIWWYIFCLFITGVGGAVRFLVVGTIGQEERPPRGQLWMEQCVTSSNTGLSSTQYEQIPIILGVWPLWLTPFFFGQ